MNNDSIYAWIIFHQQNYPEKHQTSQPRTNEAVKPLDPKSQFHLVIKALGEYIGQKILQGKGLNYQNFGAFAFEIDTNLFKPAHHSNFSIAKDLANQRQQRMHNHRIKRCFVPDKKLVEVLSTYLDKEEITKPKIQHQVYQKRLNMIFCNPVPIAAASCELDKDVVEPILKTFACALQILLNSVNHCKLQSVLAQLILTISTQPIATTPNLNLNSIIQTIRKNQKNH